MGLDASYIVLDDVLIVRLQGEIDHHEAKKLRMEWQFVLEDSRCRNVVLNMEGVTFMDSSGIGVILGRYKEIEASGGSLIVCHLDANVGRIFEMAGLYKIIRLAHSEMDACMYLGVDPSCKTK